MDDIDENEDRLMQALAFHRDGERAKAAAVYRDLLEENPGHLKAGLGLASIALDETRIEDARALLDEIIEEHEDSGVAHLLRSRVQFLSGRHSEGYFDIRRAQELLPEDEHVAAEYVAAMRRRYFTFDRGEYEALFQAAQQGVIRAARKQRLAHLALLRMLKPELIRLLVQEEFEGDAISQWMESLPTPPAQDGALDARSELSVLARNFGQAVDLMRRDPLHEPRPALLTLRGADGQEEALRGVVSDVDALTGAALELVREGEVEFVPFSQMASIEFGMPSAATSAVITLRSGEVVSGLMPLFYLFTEFSPSERARQGRSTFFRAVIPGVPVGIGLRSFEVNGKPLPSIRVERIDFADIE